MTPQFKTYPKYKPSGIDWLGDIPFGWEVKRLKYIAKVITGNTPPKSDINNYLNGKFLWIKPNELNGFYPSNKSNEKLTKKGVSLSRLIPPFSIFVNGIGNIGDFGYSEFEASTNQQINSIVFSKLIHKKFRIYLIAFMKEEFKRNSEKVVVPILSKSKQEFIKTILPPLPEQEAIAKFLDDKTEKIDRAIIQKEQMIELLKERKQILIQDAVTKGLNPKVAMKDSGVEWIGEIPEHWEVKRLKYIGKVVLGKMLCPTNKGSYVLKPYLKSKNIQWLNLNLKEVDEMWFSKSELIQYKLIKNDLILTEGGEIGKISIWKDELAECYIQNSAHKITISKHHPYYFLYILYLSGKIGVLDSIVNRVSIGHLTRDKLINVKLLVPPLNEQEEIVEYIEELSTKIDKAIKLQEEQIAKLKEYKTILIDNAVTGKIKVV